MKFLMFSILFYTQFVFAKTITCTHFEVCNLMKKNASIDLKTTVIINGDPHEFEPSTKEIKELIDAEILVSGPIDLNPWIKNILTQRAKNNKTTVILTINKKLINDYQNGSLESLSHFWLYPKIKCDLQNQINLNKNLIDLNVTNNEKCEYLNLEKEIISILKTKSSKLILAHDALAPFLRTYAPHISFITMKGSGHHEEISPASIKALYNIKNKFEVTWILEKNITIPANLKSRIDQKDNVIEVDTSIANDSNNLLPVNFKNYGTIYKFISSLK